MDLGLALVDVQRGAGDQPLVERPRQRLLVDDGAARGVHEKRRALHPRERALDRSDDGSRGVSGV